MDTLKEAKEQLRANWEKGIECPCCHQNVRLWRHKLNSQIAKTLILMFLISKREKKEWVHILNEIRPSNRMYSLARWWGLIEAKEFHREEDKKANGYWKITEKGIQFILGELRIPKYAFIFNNNFYKFSTETVDVYETLASKFSYTELMNS